MSDKGDWYTFDTSLSNNNNCDNTGSYPRNRNLSRSGSCSTCTKKEETCGKPKAKQRKRSKSRSKKSCSRSKPKPHQPAPSPCTCTEKQNPPTNDTDKQNCNNNVNARVPESYNDTSCKQIFPCLFWPVVLVVVGWVLWTLNSREVEANFALSSMGATIVSQAKEVACTPKRRVNDPQVIISGLPVIPGNAFCFEGHGQFIFGLSAPICITGITYEHIPKEVHPERHIKSAPMLFLVYGIRKDKKGNLREDYIDSFEFLDNGYSIQTAKFQNPNFATKYSEAKITVIGNHGMHFTCLYRIQIHGRV